MDDDELEETMKGGASCDISHAAPVEGMTDGQYDDIVGI
jgi:hypothetical protein